MPHSNVRKCLSLGTSPVDYVESRAHSFGEPRPSLRACLLPSRTGDGAENLCLRFSTCAADVLCDLGQVAPLSGSLFPHLCIEGVGTYTLLGSLSALRVFDPACPVVLSDIRT